MWAEVSNRFKRSAASHNKGWSHLSFLSPSRQISTKIQLMSLSPNNGMTWLLGLDLPWLGCQNANVGMREGLGTSQG